MRKINVKDDANISMMQQVFELCTLAQESPWAVLPAVNSEPKPMKGRRGDKKEQSIAKIRTWVLRSECQCAYHYTIEADIITWCALKIWMKVDSKVFFDGF